MTEQSMVARVATAIEKAAHGKRTPFDPVFVGVSPEELARAAIEAMREPTREMIEVGNTVTQDAGDIWEPSDGISYGGPSCALECWQAMISEALKE